jgi:hypothetical protein
MGVYYSLLSCFACRLEIYNMLGEKVFETQTTYATAANM